MTDTRSLQRTLFRMQADATFARDVFAGSAEALATTDLGSQDLTLLCALDPAGVSADPFEKRRTQLLGNLATEFLLTLAAANRSGEHEDLLETFPRSREFHAAVRRGDRLPFAFAHHARRRLEELSDHGGAQAALAVLELEESLARLRRESAIEARLELASGFVQLAPTSRILDLPRGTLGWCDELQASLENGEPLARAPQGLGAGREAALLCVVPTERRAPRALLEVRAELLEPPADELLRLTERPFGPDERLDYARRRGVALEELEAFLHDFVVEGVLLARGA